MTDYYIYDIETYPNCFTFACERYSDRTRWVFEISFRRNDTPYLLSFLTSLSNLTDIWMVGFNNIGFDYPIIHAFYHSEGKLGYQGAYSICQDIIGSNDPFKHTVWPSEMIVPQLDVFKINHFDNSARRTSLKQLEFVMRITDIQDLPFPPGTLLTGDQINGLIHYNMEGDVVNTRDFFTKCMKAVEFRNTFGPEWMNYNDTKIGKQWMIKALEKDGVQCFNDRKPIQTPRPVMELKDAVLPSVRFNHPEFQRIHQWFLAQTITETKGVFTDVTCNVNGFDYVFGLGGIHGSVESQTVCSDEYWVVEDWDVASYYPNLAIVNRLFPEHLGDKFCDIYRDVYNERKKHAKGTPQNAAMKLALNGTYGDSNSKYSPFYDPLYTMSITINGQLLLCMLAEMLVEIPDLTMIQINTDGLTIRYPRIYKETAHAMCKWWEDFTGLTLESAVYNRMFIRDVNNYMAVGEDGKVKRKGAYEYEREYHKNHSALVVPKAAEQVLVYGKSVEAAVRENNDMMDYCLFVKAPILELDGVPQQRRSRYYVSTTGGTLKTIKPPPVGKVAGHYKKAQGVTDKLYNSINMNGVHDPRIHTKNKSMYGPTTGEVEKGWKTTICNNILEAIAPINYNYYIERVRKLVEPVR